MCIRDSSQTTWRTCRYRQDGRFRGLSRNYQPASLLDILERQPGYLELLAHPRIGWGTHGFPELGDVNRKTSQRAPANGPHISQRRLLADAYAIRY